MRYKAEVDFDGRELTRSYLVKQDLETILEEVQNMKTIEELETFLLKHGENIVDLLGAEIDRIEKELKVSSNFVLFKIISFFPFVNIQKRHPEVRHCDLELLWKDAHKSAKWS